MDLVKEYSIDQNFLDMSSSDLLLISLSLSNAI